MLFEVEILSQAGLEEWIKERGKNPDVSIVEFTDNYEADSFSASVEDEYLSLKFSLLGAVNREKAISVCLGMTRPDWEALKACIDAHWALPVR